MIHRRLSQVCLLIICVLAVFIPAEAHSQKKQMPVVSKGKAVQKSKKSQAKRKAHSKGLRKLAIRKKVSRPGAKPLTYGNAYYSKSEDTAVARFLNGQSDHLSGYDAINYRLIRKR